MLLGPLTCSLDISGKVTSYLVEQNVLISVGVPGSWAPKSLQGNPDDEALVLVLPVQGPRAPCTAGQSALRSDVNHQDDLPWYALSEVSCHRCP